MGVRRRNCKTSADKGFALRWKNPWRHRSRGTRREAVAPATEGEKKKLKKACKETSCSDIYDGVEWYNTVVATLGKPQKEEDAERLVQQVLISALALPVGLCLCHLILQ
ncbi:hypothetical protein K438DRAFT_1986286 [Mycena galopus ATCC 62051]|nr:hypothetical protein K438DRAFT_1986286 [Mycena galopus ATCC 62051]